MKALTLIRLFYIFQEILAQNDKAVSQNITSLLALSEQ